MSAPAASPALKPVATLAEALADRSRWADLVDRALEPNALLGPAMVGSAAGRVAPADWSVLAVEDRSGALSALCVQRIARLAPLFGPAHVETFWSPFAPLGTPLISASAPPDEPALAEALLDGWARLAPVVRLRFQRLDGPFVGLLCRAAEARGIAVEATDVHERAILRADEPEAEALGPGLKGRRARDLRRLERRLAEGATLSHDTLSDPQACAVALEEHLALEHASWKGRRGTSLAADAGHAAFARRLVAESAATGRLRIDRLRRNERTIASLITLLAGRRAFLWKIAHDEALDEAAPGVQLIAAVTRAALADPAIDEVDSLAAPGHPVVGRLWSGRARYGTLILATEARHNRRAAHLVTLHDGAVRLRGLARTVRDRLKPA